MASVPTPEESAKRILAIFRRDNVKTGEVMMAGAVNAKFLTESGTAPQYEEGMKFALDKKWIEEALPAIRLLKAGFDAT